MITGRADRRPNSHGSPPALKVDKETYMKIVTDVKQELRKANALKINYSTGRGR